MRTKTWKRHREIKNEYWPVYPEVQTLVTSGVATPDNEVHIITKTVLRKEHKGTYYLWPVRHKIVCKEENVIESLIQANDRLHDDVYYALILGSPSKDLRDEYGDEVFPEDEDQTPETDSLLEHNLVT